MRRFARGKRRRAAIIVLVAISLPILLVFAGFAVDLATMQRARSELRVATDLAAKAATDELQMTGNVAQARLAGQAVAFENLVMGKGLRLKAEDFVFGAGVKQSSGAYQFVAGALPTNAVQVSSARDSSNLDGGIGLFFGGLYGSAGFEPNCTATAAFVNIDICLVLDRSTSMKRGVSETKTRAELFCLPPEPTSRWAFLDQAIDVFTNILASTGGPENVALVTFGGECTAMCRPAEYVTPVTVDQDLTTNLALIDWAIGTRTTTVWNGNTDIAAAITAGTNVMANARPNSEKVMIVLTDGNYTTTDPNVEAAVAAANGITIHTITYSAQANQTDMQNVATTGGGTHYHAPDGDALEDVFKEIAASFVFLVE